MDVIVKSTMDKFNKTTPSSRDPSRADYIGNMGKSAGGREFVA
jgi:hypothetical protein